MAVAGLAGALVLAACGTGTGTGTGTATAAGTGPATGTATGATSDPATPTPTVAGTESVRPAPSTTASTSTASRGTATRAQESFVFGAGGDLGANDRTAAGLAKLDASPARFFLALGDLDYDQTPSDEAWCDFVLDRLPTKGRDFPVELVSGNHEADGGPDGRVANMAGCLGDKMGSRGHYGAQYSFRYPATDPLATVVMISPRLRVDGHTYDYSGGTADRTWLVRQIDRSRAAGIPWVVVGMHYPCYSTGAAHGCDAGAPVMTLLARKRVDLLLVGHNHLYERSKQIRLGDGCRVLRAGRYNGACVSDDGADGVYGKGRGLVQVTSGRVGGRQQGIDRSDPDRRWFVKAGSGTTGWTQVTVTPSRLTASWVRTGGTMQDTFTIR